MLGAAACSSPKPEQPIAWYRGVELYAEDVWQVQPAAPASPQDSLRLLRQFATDWLRDQVLAHAALDSLPAANREVELLVARYRTQLLRQALRRHVLQQIDSTVADTALQAYYAAHRTAYLATTPLIQYRMLRIPSSRVQPGMISQLATATPEQLHNWNLLCVDQAEAECYLHTAWTDIPGLARLGLPEAILREAPGTSIGGTALWAPVRTEAANFVVAFVPLARVASGEPLPLELALPAVQAAIQAQRANAYLHATETRLLQQALQSRDASLSPPLAAQPAAQ